MAVSVFSILGVILAFLGLAAFLVSLISLLPINIYNAIKSSLILKDAIAISDRNSLPTLFFAGTIFVAMASLGLFLVMTSKSKGKTAHNDSAYGSTTNIGNPNNTNTKPSILAKNKHRVINIYSITYIIIDVIWLVAGVLLFHSMENNNSDHDDETRNSESIRQAIRSQIYITGLNLMILVISVGAMASSSILFYLGKNNSESSNPNYHAV